MMKRSMQARSMSRPESDGPFSAMCATSPPAGKHQYLKLPATCPIRLACPADRPAGPAPATTWTNPGPPTATPAPRPPSKSPATQTDANVRKPAPDLPRKTGPRREPRPAASQSARIAVAAARNKKGVSLLNSMVLSDRPEDTTTSILFRSPSLRTGRCSSVYRRHRLADFRRQSHFARPPPVGDEWKKGLEQSRSPQGRDVPRVRCGLSVDRRELVSHRAFFEHFGFPRGRKIWWPMRVGSIPRRVLP